MNNQPIRGLRKCRDHCKIFFHAPRLLAAIRLAPYINLAWREHLSRWRGANLLLYLRSGRLSWMLSSSTRPCAPSPCLTNSTRDAQKTTHYYYLHTRAAHTRLLLDVSLCWLLAHDTLTLFVTLSLVVVITESFYRQLSSSVIARENVCVKNGLLLAIWCLAPAPSLNPSDW